MCAMANFDKNQLAKDVFKVAHLRGEFKLRSGQISNEYFDKYQFGALEMGGIPVATALSLITGIPVVFIRKEAKDYGTCRFAEGPAIKNKKVCLIEDVITTGGQVVISTNDLRKEGAVIDTVLCVIDRSGGKTEKLKETGLTHKALFTMDELKTAGGAH